MCGHCVCLVVYLLLLHGWDITSNLEGYLLSYFYAIATCLLFVVAL